MGKDVAQSVLERLVIEYGFGGEASVPELSSPVHLWSYFTCDIGFNVRYKWRELARGGFDYHVEVVGEEYKGVDLHVITVGGLGEDASYDVIDEGRGFEEQSSLYCSVGDKIGDIWKR